MCRKPPYIKAYRKIPVRIRFKFLGVSTGQKINSKREKEKPNIKNGVKKIFVAAVHPI